MSITGGSQPSPSDEFSLKNPADVVRMLLQFSLASGATTISIDISNGGITNIIVSDNGRGLDSNEILSLAVTEPFRSLSFDAEVDLITIDPISKIESGMYSYYGDIKTYKPLRNQDGNRIHVKNLFFQNPARYKTLRNDISESNQVYYVLKHYAISRPSVSFRLTNNGATVFHTPGNNLTNDCLAALFPQYDFDELSVTDYSDMDYEIRIFISPKKYKFLTSSDVFIYNKDRPIINPLLNSAVNDLIAKYSLCGFVPFILLTMKFPDDAFQPEYLHNVGVPLESRNALIHIIDAMIRQKLGGSQNQVAQHTLNDPSSTLPVKLRQLPVHVSCYPVLSDPYEFSGLFLAKYLIIIQQQFVYLIPVINTDFESKLTTMLQNPNEMFSIISDLICQISRLESSYGRIICFVKAEFESLFLF